MQRILKNTAGQKITLLAWDTVANAPKTGDAANLTAYRRLDHAAGPVTALTDSSATEVDATNAKGLYDFDLTQGETNGDLLQVTGKSSTANVIVFAKELQTVAANPDTQIAAIKAKTDNLPANTSTTLSGIETKVDTVDTVVDAVKAKTDNLPSDPADASVVAGLISTLSGLVSASDGKIDIIDSLVDAIKAITDKLDTAVELDGAVYRFTENALEMGPSSEGGLTLNQIANAVNEHAVPVAIKAKTDKLNFNATNEVLADVRRANNVAVTGDGSDENPWNPA